MKGIAGESPSSQRSHLAKAADPCGWESLLLKLNMPVQENKLKGNQTVSYASYTVFQQMKAPAFSQIGVLNQLLHLLNLVLLLTWQI